MDVVLTAFFYYCNIELTVLLCTGIWQPKSRNHMLRKNDHEPHELLLAPPTGASQAPGQGVLLTHKAVSQNWGKETRWEQWPRRTKRACRRAHSSHHAKGNWIMCSATGEILPSHLHCSYSNRKETHPYNRCMDKVAHCGRARTILLKPRANLHEG